MNSKVFQELLLVPNLLTMSRILLSPLILILFDSIWWLFIIGLYTGVSDYLDGFFARKLNQSSVLGAYLDPIADKLLVVMFLVAAISRGMLAPWMIGALLIRDLYTLFAYIAYLLFYKDFHGKITLEARYPGKVVTLVQFLCLTMLALLPTKIWLVPEPLWHWRNWLFLLLIPVSIWSAIDYQMHYVKLTRKPIDETNGTD